MAADLQGALKTPERKHYSSLSISDLPEFLRKVADYDGHLQTRLGLRLLLLTATRTVELRAARWGEFDFDNALWHIPAERVKTRRPHIVPLSKQALETLQTLKTLNGLSSYLFPNRNRPETYMSENTLLYALYRMGYHFRATGHGFRATFSTIMNEMGYRDDVIERQLAHDEQNKVRAAYNRAKYLEERRALMQAWADHLDALVQGAPVIPFSYRVA